VNLTESNTESLQVSVW